MGGEGQALAKQSQAANSQSEATDSSCTGNVVAGGSKCLPLNSIQLKSLAEQPEKRSKKNKNKLPSELTELAHTSGTEANAVSQVQDEGRDTTTNNESKTETLAPAETDPTPSTSTGGQLAAHDSYAVVTNSQVVLDCNQEDTSD